MNRSWDIDRLARGIQDGGLIAAVRSQQTQNIIDDAFALWRDSRAAHYFSSFADPQSLTFPEIIGGLRMLGEQLGQLSRDAAECDRGVNIIRLESVELESVWFECDKACVDTGYLAQNARSWADDATSVAKRVAASVAEHRHPPV